MPGLVGCAGRGREGCGGETPLAAMADLLRHASCQRTDDPFEEEVFAATRCHSGILQVQPQPHSRAGRHLWLDGELYNRSEIDPGSSNDLQLLLDLYLRDGFESLHRLDGLFAAVLYDAPGRQVHLLGDRYGLRPLYWTEHQGRLAWSSEVKAFLALPGFAPRLDRSALRSFLGIGYLHDNLTWFEGVRRLPAASVLTWDLEAGKAAIRRYWWWDRIAPLGPVQADDLAAELGALFAAAVRRRCHPAQQVGLVLSGGLDSRAILAALPGSSFPAVTFGRPGSPESRIAARAARLKSVEHHFFPIDAANWIGPRLDAVWRSDGMLDLMHMHGVEAIRHIKSLFAIALNGAGGDGLAGGGHIFDRGALAHHLEFRLGVDRGAHPGLVAELENYFARLGSAHAFYIDHRMRSFTIYALVLGSCQGLECRLPFMDNQFQEMLYAAPDHLKRGNHLYHRMLLRTFPQFYRRIPWQATGVPISWPRWAARAWRALRRGNPGFVDYSRWIRQEPGRALCAKILNDRAALYPEYIPRLQVRRAWEEHCDGGDRSAELCRYLTLEVLLQQVFAEKWRPSA